MPNERCARWAGIGRPGASRTGAVALGVGVAVAGDEEAGGAGKREKGGEAPGRRRGGGQHGDGTDQGEDGFDAFPD